MGKHTKFLPRLYIVTTDDKYELPVLVSENIEDIMSFLQMRRNSIARQVKAGQFKMHKVRGLPYKYCYINYDTLEDINENCN